MGVAGEDAGLGTLLPTSFIIVPTFNSKRIESLCYELINRCTVD